MAIKYFEICIVDKTYKMAAISRMLESDRCYIFRDNYNNLDSILSIQILLDPPLWTGGDSAPDEGGWRG